MRSGGEGGLTPPPPVEISKNRIKGKKMCHPKYIGNYWAIGKRFRSIPPKLGTYSANQNFCQNVENCSSKIVKKIVVVLFSIA